MARVACAGLATLAGCAGLATLAGCAGLATLAVDLARESGLVVVPADSIERI